MIELRPSRAGWGVMGALFCASSFALPQPKIAPKTNAPAAKNPAATPPAAKISAISASAYRQRLQKALDDLKTPRPAANTIFGSLDAPFDVRRADGKIQRVSGNLWSDFRRDLGATTPTKSISASRAKRAQQLLELQIAALDEWTKTPVYQPVDARKIVLELEASGQIRTGPLWWQKMLSNAWGAVAKAWQAFIKWFFGLFPTPTPLKTTRMPSDKWLWFLFYCFVAAILGFLIWLTFRTFGFTWGRRKIKNAQEMVGEDAELLQLPPQELLSRAEQFAAQGNFREALRHRYLALLLDLDARGVWRYDARRTNWEHIAALSRSEKARDLVPPLSDLTRRFDRVRYGGAACDVEGWRRFDGDARGFESTASGHQNAAREMEPVR